MKRILIFSAIALLGLATISGCKKKDSSPGYTMKASVGGTSFNVTNAYATLTGTILSITGSSGSTISATPPYLSVMLANYTGTGTYNVDTTSSALDVSGTWAPDATMTNWKSTHSGTVTITSATATTIVGTFNFLCLDGTVISGGSFTAKKVN